MPQSRWLQSLRSLGLRFWLTLPLLGLGFWGISHWMMRHLLNQSDTLISDFQIEEYRETPSAQVLSIKVHLDRQQEISRIKVKSVRTVSEEQEFEVSTTNLRQLEATIAERLNLSREQVRALIRYQVRE